MSRAGSCHLNDLMYVKVVEGKYSGIAQDDNHRIITLVERSVTNFLISYFLVLGFFC